MVGTLLLFLFFGITFLLILCQHPTTSQEVIFKNDSTTDTSSPPPQYHSRQYIGCYTDIPYYLAMKHPIDLPYDEITVDNCMNNCLSSGYKFSGTEYGIGCFCSSDIPNAEKYPKRPDSDCNTDCAGDVNQKCGGHWRLSIYATGLNYNY